MTPIRLTSACWSGTKPLIVTVEIDIQPGLPLIHVVGMPDRLVNEAAIRVRSAIKNSQLTFPKGRVTISLSPVHLPKQGSSLDAVIAVGLLLAQEKRSLPWYEYAVLGELDLSGVLQVPPRYRALLAVLARERPNILCIGACAELPSLLSSRVIPCKNLSRCLQQIHQPQPLIRLEPVPEVGVEARAQLIGQCVETAALRGAVLAAAGGHHLSLAGRPGVGKTHIAQIVQALLPDLSDSEHLSRLANSSHDQVELRQVERLAHSTSAQVFNGSAMRMPAWHAAIGGILLLDELHLYRQELRETLKPWFSAYAEYARNHSAPLTVIATFNPCPCGHGVSSGICSCTAAQLAQYKQKFPEALLQRFQLAIEVQGEGTSPTPIGEGAANQLIKSVQRAKCTQENRNPQRLSNGLLNYAELLMLPLSRESVQLLAEVSKTLQLSLRAQQSLLAVSRTIADIDLKESTEIEHVYEALQYRYRPVG